MTDSPDLGKLAREKWARGAKPRKPQDPAYRNAVARARNAALMRLADRHPVEFQNLLTEERNKQGIPYQRGTMRRIRYIR